MKVKHVRCISFVLSLYHVIYKRYSTYSYQYIFNISVKLFLFFPLSPTEYMDFPSFSLSTSIALFSFQILIKTIYVIIYL